MSLHPQVQRCYDLAIRGAWKHPFFLIPLGHVEWHEAKDTKKVKTMAISTQVKSGKVEINLHINTEWTKSIPDDEIFGVLAHEIMHSMLRHAERGGGKQEEFWGMAADMAINASLVQSDIKLPGGALLPPREHYEAAAEELYTLLLEEQINAPKNYDPDKATQGCMPQKGNQQGEDQSQGQGEAPGESGDGEGEGDGEGQGQGKSDGETASNRAFGEMIAQAQNYSRGTGTAKVMARMFAPKPVKTLWERLIRKVANRAQAKGGRDTQSFTRVNRRSGSSDIIFPGWQSTSPTVAVLIDTSGSVSDEMLRASLSSVIKIAGLTSVRMFLALHDGVCYYSGWLNPETTVEKLSTLCTARGGTDPRGAFEALAKAKGRFDAAVYLTDGEVGTYPDKPQNVKRMIVGVVGDGKYRAAVPESWQEVLVEIVESKD